MNTPPTEPLLTTPTASAGTESQVSLRVRRLTKTYGDGPTRVDAVHELDLDVHRGEVLLVMGPSGSGKTTLLLMIGGLLRPTSGSIEVIPEHGRTVDLAVTPERQLPGLRAHTFGFIFQDYALLDALTATENIAVATNLAGLRGPAATARARELLERVGLSHRATARPSQMSGGEQQRVAVARALANDPPVLLADEPTANLDASRGRDLSRLLRRLADEDQRSVVIVSYDDRLREVADRVLWLEDGGFKAVAGLVVDPVCRMLVEANGPSIEQGGKTYWFCSEGCRREYAEAPGRFQSQDPTSR